MVLAHAEIVAAKVADSGIAPDRTVLFLHGIFGSGANWRSFARRYVEARPSYSAVLVDLRKHGDSQAFDPPHDLAHTAHDVRMLAASLPRPVDTIVGHSFGGKVVLAILAEADRAAAEGRESPFAHLTRAVVVDSTPSARADARGSESTLAILGLLESLPEVLESRESFAEALTAHGLSQGIVQWLAMNVRRRDEGGFRFRVDLAAVRSLLDDYFARDLWSVLEHPAPGRRVDLVVGGRSDVFDAADRQRARALADRAPDSVGYTVIPDAGHWVHVDAPDALFAELLR